MFLHVRESLQIENEDLKELSGPKAYTQFYTKNNELWRCDKRKGLGLEAVSCGTAARNYMRGKLMEDKDYVSLHRSFPATTPSLW